MNIHLMPPPGTTLARTVVRVQGERPHTLGRGVTRLQLSFAGRPPSPVRVDLRATTTLQLGVQVDAGGCQPSGWALRVG